MSMIISASFLGKLAFYLSESGDHGQAAAEWSDGVLGCWSDGGIYPTLQYSITPTLHDSEASSGIAASSSGLPRSPARSRRSQRKVRSRRWRQTETRKKAGRRRREPGK